MAKKIIIAVNNEPFEVYLKQILSRTEGESFEFSMISTYREGALQGIDKYRPDIYIMTESLPGNIDTISMLKTIRQNYPQTRIIFIAEQRDKKDKFLSALVMLNIWDFLVGNEINGNDVINLVLHPNKYEDIKDYMPDITTGDFGDLNFEVPNINVIEEGENEPEEEEDNEEDDDFSITEPDDDIEESISKPKKAGFFDSVKNIKIEPKLPRFNKTPKAPKPPKPEVKIVKEVVTERQNVVTDRIITFVSGKSGSGATTMALNSATQIAKSGYKVLLIEFNETTPSIPYLFQIGKNNEGIDTALDYLNKGMYKDIPKAITKTAQLKKESKEFKKFPDTLDFCFFSRGYIRGLTPKIESKNTERLYTHLMVNLGYDFIILDLPSNFHSNETKAGIIYSHKVFFCITQDVSSIGYLLMDLNEYEEDGVSTVGKSRFILNRYIPHNIVSKKYIADWIGVREEYITTMPVMDETFILSNYEGRPAIIGSKDELFIGQINSIVNQILS